MHISAVLHLMNLILCVFQDQINYVVVGDYPAQSFFNVGLLNGDVKLIRPVTEDSLQSTSYQVITFCVVKIPSLRKVQFYRPMYNLTASNDKYANC